MRFLLVFFALMLSACGADKTPGTKATAISTQPWHLDEDASRLSFMSIKKGSVIEVHGFGPMVGTAPQNGDVIVEIILDTVETNIDIRNTRMREHLFETNQYPIAQIETLIIMDDFQTLEIGEHVTIVPPVTVQMHGVTASYDIPMVVTRLSVNKIMVQNVAPIIVDASDFGMEAGIEKLRQLASLPSITTSVPVSFVLVFNQNR